MAIAAARALARYAVDRGINERYIVPRLDEWEACPAVAAATSMQAQEQGLSRLSKTREELFEEAVKIIQQARQATH